MNLAEGTLHLSSQEWREAAGHALEALSAIGLQEDDCEARAWLLIHRALTEAVFQLAEESADRLHKAIPDPERFVASLNLEQSLEQHPLCLDRPFFLHPERCTLLEQLQPPLCQWLQASGCERAQARSISQRLPSCFVLALNNQWRKRAEEYACLQQVVETPFTQAAAREHAWNRYRTWLQEQVERPLFGTAISLCTLYIPLHGSCREPGAAIGEREDEPQKVALHATLWRWLHSANGNDPVRLLCGGPGSGKSTLAKMFAAEVAREGTIPLLFIPLHLLHADTPLLQALQAFVAADPCWQEHNPLEAWETQERLFLLLDGLEEWGMQSSRVVEGNRRLIEQLWQLLARFNQRRSCLQVLLTARTPLCAANADPFRLPGQVLHLLPYAPARNGAAGQADGSDQRSLWWSAYARATGREDGERPAPWHIPALETLTAHPLINHLLALYSERGHLELFQESGRNRLYQEVVTGIFQRAYEGGRNPATQGWTAESFARLLEGVAVAAWHSRTWRATVTGMVQSCPVAAGLAGSGRGAPSREALLRLLTAFCFRRAGSHPGGEPAHAFLHPSFAEFFIARRLVRLIQQLGNGLRLARATPGQGLDGPGALLRWFALCGPAGLEGGIFVFLCRELARHAPRTVWEWQKQLAYLLGHLLKSGPPLPRGEVTGQEVIEQARQGSLALLAALNGCARHSGRRSPRWVLEPAAFGSWLHSLRRQRTVADAGCVALAWLSHLDLSGVVLRLADLHGADLRNTDLRGADLFGANLGQADLRGARLEGACLEGACLEGARGWEGS
ncbi:MAG: pentapeptide repeat-containing protein [Magnetococcus sp. MYC-9]